MLTARDLKKLMRPHESWPQALARVHHEAYLLGMLGDAACGLPQKEIAALRASGLAVLARQEPNPFEIVLEASGVFGRAPSPEQLEMRSWSGEKWKKTLSRRLVEKIAPKDGGKTIKLRDLAVALPANPHAVEEHSREDERLAPEAQARSAALRLDKTRRHAAAQAAERAGIYCKRLGELAGGDFSQPTTERWHFSKIIDQVDPELRGRRLRAIRKDVQSALLHGWTAKELADSLRAATADYARDWMRVAVTELQNAWNEGVALTAVQEHGPHAKIARIPETTACHKCRDLFLGPGGDPVVFDLHRLIANGSNMNKKPPQWLPTLSAIHPFCRCGTIPVPANTKPRRDGLLVPLQSA